MKKFAFAVAAAASSVALIAGPATAAVTFDSATGTGFVGKGDVQLALGLNNAQLQAQGGSLIFTYEAVSAQETSWICVNDRNGNEQEREQTTTTSTSGVASSVARVKNQITGFNLTGFSGTSETSATDGPKLNTCPNANSTYQLDSTTVGDPVVTGGLSVNGVALQ